MDLNVLKMLIQSACADGELTNEKKKHLQEKAKQAKVSALDLDFLINNELKKINKNKAQTSLNASLNDKSGFEAYNKSGFVSIGSITEQVSEKDDFTDISQHNTTGSMSIILKAKYFGKWVAIKAIKPEFKNNQVFLELFDKEFKNTFELEHEHIIRIYGKSKNIVDPYYFMEFVDGNQLSQMIADNGIKSGALIKKISTQILSALEYCHKKQIFHRDLKPENILITHKGDNVKLIDFGLALSDNYQDILTNAGTPIYMAPEQKKNAQETDGRSDIYSFGLILTQMLCGSTTYLESINLRSPKISNILKKCVAINPKDRYQNASEIIYELKNIPILDLKFELRLSTNKINFGEIEMGENKMSEVKIINRGIGVLTWKITSKIPQYFSIQQKHNILTITFKAESAFEFNDEFVISSNGGDALLKVFGKVISKPQLATDIDSLEFNSLIPDNPMTKRIEVFNSGSGVLNWTLKESPIWLICKAFKNHIYIEYESTKFASLKGNIIIESNGGSKNIPISIKVNNGKNPILDVSPTQIRFENVPLGEMREAIVDIENIGAGELDWKVTKISEWLLIDKLPTGLKITFVPKKEGNFVGNIVIKSNASDENITISASVIKKISFIKKNKQNILIAVATFAALFILYLIPYAKIATFISQTAKLNESTQLAKNKEVNLISNEENLWQATAKQNSISAYSNFIKQYPESNYCKLADSLIHSKSVVWKNTLSLDNRVSYYKFMKKFEKSENIKLAYLLFNLTDTAVCFTIVENSDFFITEDIMLVIKNKQVNGRLLGNSLISDSVWISDLTGTRKNDTLYIKQNDFSGLKLNFKLIIRENSAIKKDENGQELVYMSKKCQN